jgi:site-specific DNA-methyltransferase (adenine-specific)
MKLNEYIEITNEDNMELMARYPDKYFDLAIIDPPYGLNLDGGQLGYSKHEKKNWDSCSPQKEYFDELFRVSKNQIIWGGNYFTDYLQPSKDWVLWDKCNPNLSFAEGELAWVRSGKNLRIFKHYSAQVEKGGKIHPTQKPIALYRWLLKNYAKQGDKILDTHVGSASSLIACYQMNFDYIGFELDKEYFEKAQKRIEQEKAQISLFYGGD